MDRSPQSSLKMLINLFPVGKIHQSGVRQLRTPIFIALHAPEQRLDRPGDVSPEAAPPPILGAQHSSAMSQAGCERTSLPRCLSRTTSTGSDQFGRRTCE